MQHNKKCPKCRVDLPLEAFGSNRSTRDGKNCYCRSCVALISRERSGYHAKWRAKNREKWNAQSRKWTANNSERRRQIVADSDKKNRKARLEQKRKFYVENKHKWKGLKCSPEVRLAIKNRYRANKAKAIHVPYRASDIYRRDNFLCVYCGANAQVLDHVVPISRGGQDAGKNLVAACKRCNCAKRNKLLKEWKPEFIGVISE